MRPDIQLCAGAGGGRRRESNHSEPDERQQKSLRLNGTCSDAQFIPNCWRRRSSKLMLFLRQLKANAFSQKWKLLKTHSSLFHVVMVLCPKELLRHVGLFTLALNDPQLMCLSGDFFVSFLLPATTSQWVISPHLPLCLLVFEFCKNQTLPGKMRKSIC